MSCGTALNTHPEWQAALRTWPPSRSASMDDVEVLGLEFRAHDDYWHLYETLSRRLEEERVVVLRDLQAVHPRAAAAISHLCDDTYPPFPQSVLILLLNPGAGIYPQDAEAEQASSGGGGRAVVVAEQCLVDCWLARAPPPSSGALPPAWSSPSALPGVLARLTGRAVLVQPEPPPQQPPPPPDSTRELTGRGVVHHARVEQQVQ
ncbi:putative ubiquitin carboxyl-terminal hydrolase FAF-X [Frankliniella fusca]|uniref:Ubiquitin carboxyl-terminal hydrolase FAF-X n=1 Tax=Frankliniella fusca TaxID=407009 RepID=A0AAE1GPS0_9NEOP|nr:putative ubiquitin carboxyl-terminal hydrolase FAF-X [Frankliniella fusca]